MDASADTRGRPAIEMTVPADSAYLSVLRTAAAGLAARLNFTLDDIEDLRIAVDEACSMLLAQAAGDSRMHCSFVLTDDSVTVSVSAHAPNPKVPSRNGFAWTVLTALATKVDFEVRGAHELAIILTHRRPTYGRE
ncbi:MAG: ATP-binding protein [Nocardioidaceae bacterium]